ncbi:hypothetical protein D3Z50_18980 [Clostridiaceae bacterium]|nr:hypothetical protein [Clostridiaceae bacterium]
MWAAVSGELEQTKAEPCENGAEVNVLFHIIMFILKILGILLLAVLAVFLLILLAVLCAPVRYRAQGSFHGSIAGAAKVTWLWPLLSAQVFYEQEPGFVVRLLGIPVLRSGKKNQEEDAPDFAAEGADGIWEDGTDTEPVPEEEADAFSGSMDADTEDDLILSAQELGDSGDDGEADGGGTAAKKKKRHKKRKKKQVQDGEDAGTGPLERLAGTFRGLRDKLLDVKDKKDRLTAFLTDEENRKTFRLIRRQLIRILKHLLPTRLEGNLVFGLEDPYTMGQALSAAAFFYPLYGRRLILNPVFDESVIEGDLRIRGRIRAGVPAAAALRILMNRNFRRQLKRIRKGI